MRKRKVVHRESKISPRSKSKPESKRSRFIAGLVSITIIMTFLINVILRLPTPAFRVRWAYASSNAFTEITEYDGLQARIHNTSITEVIKKDTGDSTSFIGFLVIDIVNDVAADNVEIHFRNTNEIVVLKSFPQDRCVIIPIDIKPGFSINEVKSMSEKDILAVESHVYLDPKKLSYQNADFLFPMSFSSQIQEMSDNLSDFQYITAGDDSPLVSSFRFFGQ